MTSLLFGIILSALLSLTSFLTVYFRVGPFSAPEQAKPAFFGSLFLSIASLSCLLFALLWRYLPHQRWDLSKILTVSLRQGILLSFSVLTILGFHLFDILNWWIAVLILFFFLLIELIFQS